MSEKKLSKTGNVFFILCMSLAVLGALYLGGWLCFVGGIVQVVESFKVDPINSLGVAVGILRVCSASLVAGLTFWGSILLGSVLLPR